MKSLEDAYGAFTEEHIVNRIRKAKMELIDIINRFLKKHIF